eukprot:756811-Hanusia_phi.AAC.1
MMYGHGYPGRASESLSGDHLRSDPVRLPWHPGDHHCIIRSESPSGTPGHAVKGHRVPNRPGVESGDHHTMISWDRMP